MPYTAEITRDNPTFFLFLVDQSRSMQEDINADGGPLQKAVAQLRVSTSWTFRTDDRQATPQRGRSPCKSIQLSCGRIGAPISTI